MPATLAEAAPHSPYHCIGSAPLECTTSCTARQCFRGVTQVLRYSPTFQHALGLQTECTACIVHSSGTAAA